MQIFNWAFAIDFLLIILFIYFVYAPVLLALSTPGLSALERMRWGLLCCCLSWVGYGYLKWCLTPDIVSKSDAG